MSRGFCINLTAVGVGVAHIFEAVMLDSWACLPVCLSPLPVSVDGFVSVWVSVYCLLSCLFPRFLMREAPAPEELDGGVQPTHYHNWGLHLAFFPNRNE